MVRQGRRCDRRRWRATDPRDGTFGGYSILEAGSPEALQSILEGHPHTTHGGTIDTYEFLPMPGQ